MRYSDVRFKNQGLDLIEVQDNGAGISPANYTAVALKHCSHGCVIDKELLDAGVFRSHGDAIYHLKLLIPVIRPVSLWQIRMEHKIRGGKRH